MNHSLKMMASARSNHQLFFNVLVLRVRWYLWCTIGLVRRHWQWLVIATLLIPMGMSVPDIINLLAWPVVTIVDPDRTWANRVAAHVLFQIIAVLWIVPQRWQIEGSPLSPYLNSLPLGSATRILVDVSVLLLATSLALLPFAVGIALSAKTPLLSSSFTVLYLLESASLLTLTQLLVLRQRWVSLTITLCLVALLATSISIEDTWASWFFLVVVAAGLAIGYSMARSHLKRPPTSISAANRAKANSHHRPPMGLRSANKWFYILLMARLLWDERASILPRLFGAFAITAFAAFLAVQFEFDSRTDALTVVAATFTTALLAGIYTIINRSRAPMIEYMNSLPLTRHFWRVVDTLTVLIVALLPYSVYTVVLIIDPASSAKDISLILSVQCFALIALGHVLLARTKHKVALVVCLCFAVSWLTLVMI